MPAQSWTGALTCPPARPPACIRELGQEQARRKQDHEAAVAQLRTEHDGAAAKPKQEHEQVLKDLHALTETKAGAEKVALQQTEEARKETAALQERLLAAEQGVG